MSITHAPLDTAAVCPKCRCDEVQTNYYPAVAHLGCPFYGQNAIIANNLASVLFDGIWKPDERRADKTYDEWMGSYRDRKEAPEHFDRRCSRCGYGWVEGMPT